jgi:hypothetical protein
MSVFVVDVSVAMNSLTNTPWAASAIRLQDVP